MYGRPPIGIWSHEKDQGGGTNTPPMVYGLARGGGQTPLMLIPHVEYVAVGLEYAYTRVYYTRLRGANGIHKNTHVFHTG